MKEAPTLEILMRKLLTPIINQAVDEAFTRHFSATSTPPPSDQNGILDIKKTAEFLLLSVTTVYSLVHKRSIPHYKQGKRLYFKKSDLLKWITDSRRLTIEEINQQADKYVLRTKKRH